MSPFRIATYSGLGLVVLAYTLLSMFAALMRAIDDLHWETDL